MAMLKCVSALAHGAAAFGLLMASTNALAQITPEEDCQRLAFANCSFDEQGRRIEVTAECYFERYEACIANYPGGGGSASLTFTDETTATA